MQIDKWNRLSWYKIRMQERVNVMVSIISEKNDKDKTQLKKLKHTYMVVPCDIDTIENLYQSGALLGEVGMDEIVKSNPNIKSKLEQANKLIEEVTDWFFKNQILPNYEIDYEGGFYHVNVPHEIAPWNQC